MAAQVGVHRMTVHRWVGRYLAEQVGGLADRSHRPAVVSASGAGAGGGRGQPRCGGAHPRWGSRRIRLELLRRPLPWSDPLVVVPSERTIDRILIRQGLVRQRKAKRPRSSFQRFERPGPMQLWGIDIVGGIQLVNPVTGELREAKIVTGVDDHSRFCVMAKVVERATGRAVCLAFAQALARHGVPEEVITDNGKQFTDRFSRYGPPRGEVLFDKICRKNGITHRLTAAGLTEPEREGGAVPRHLPSRDQRARARSPRSLPRRRRSMRGWANTTPNVPIRASMRRCRSCRPTGSTRQPATQPRAGGAVGAALAQHRRHHGGSGAGRRPGSTREPGDPVELDKVVPASGNMTVCGNQFWLGPARAGQVVRFWVDCEWVHLSDRWAAGQVAAVAVQRQRPGPPRRPGRGPRRPGSAAITRRSGKPRRTHHRRGRTDRRQGRDRVAGQPGRPGRGDPRRPSGRDLYRGRCPAAVLRPPDA